MERCHPRSIEILMQFLGPIQPRSLFRALDVAGGDGRFSSSFLLKHYRKVDLFDQCPQAQKKAKNAMRGHKALGYVSIARMQEFQWRFDYSAIFMVWCAGYLGRQELLSFLRKAKTHLIQYSTRTSRTTAPESFIFLLDNVLIPGEEPFVVKGQLQRSQKELEAIFDEAGLLVHKCSERQSMPSGIRDVCVWALY